MENRTPTFNPVVLDGKYDTVDETLVKGNNAEVLLSPPLDEEAILRFLRETLDIYRKIFQDGYYYEDFGDFRHYILVNYEPNSLKWDSVALCCETDCICLTKSEKKKNNNLFYFVRAFWSYFPHISDEDDDDEFQLCLSENSKLVRRACVGAIKRNHDDMIRKGMERMYNFFIWFFTKTRSIDETIKMLN